jgi:hypothetical protein
MILAVSTAGSEKPAAWLGACFELALMHLLETDTRPMDGHL